MVEVRTQIDKKTIIQTNIKTNDLIEAIQIVQKKYPQGIILSAIYFNARK